MKQLKRYYNQNRKRIWSFIIIIAFLFTLLQLANFFVKRQNEQIIQQANTGQMIFENTASSSNGTNILQNNNNQTIEKATEQNTIEKFFEYCNKKELESAYNMLTDECKEQMFSDIETFERIYYNSAFQNQEKDTSIEKWAGSTYLVYFKQSALATGKVTKEQPKGDYITVIKNGENNYKLNINRYVGYKEINKDKENENVKIEVLHKNIYMNYEEYKIKVSNKANKDINLNGLDNSEAIYIEDSNSTKYYPYSHELSEDLLTILAGNTREISLKFYNSYTQGRKIKSLVFSNVMIENKNVKFTVNL